MSVPLLTALCMLASFLICGIPFGLIVARAHGVDIRSVGSGNIGMTNVARSVGGSAAAVTFGLDVAKGTVCVLLARLALSQLCLGGVWAQTSPQQDFGWASALVWASCVLGHMFSPYLGFHGGKGISVGLGAGLGFSPVVILLSLAVFLAVALPTRYVSAGSICAALSLPILGALMAFTPGALVPTAVVAALVVWSHRANISRLCAGTENAFSIRKK